jgi:hypothetical protein
VYQTEELQLCFASDRTPLENFKESDIIGLRSRKITLKDRLERGWLCAESARDK